MAWALQVALAWSTGTWALNSWTTQLQVKGIKPAGGVLANLAKSSVAAFVQRWLITLSRKLWACAVGAIAPAAPRAIAVTRTCRRDGGLKGMGFLDEGSVFGSMVFQGLHGPFAIQNLAYFGGLPVNPRVRLGRQGGR